MSLMGFGLYTGKNRKKARAARLCALFIITASLLSFTLSTVYGVVLDEEKDKETQQDAPKDALSKLKEDANPPSMYAPGGIVLDEKGNKETPLYVPGEVIIKLKEKKGQQGRLSAMAYSERAGVEIDTLSILKSKYNLHSEEPLFKGLHNQLKAHNLSVRQLEAQNEAKLQEKAIRPPQEAKGPDLFPIYILKTDEDVLAVCARLKEDPNVEYAEPNGIVKIQMLPNDPYYYSNGSWSQAYDDLWGIKKIQCEQAWDISQGEGVVVAVIDTGVDYNHEDIAANIWTNPGEIPNNGIDDDNNGYVDDVHGYDFAYNDADPMDGFGHGTHVSGTIAAVGNNGIGVIGVAPKARIMAVKGLGDDGSGTYANLAQCVMYAANNGAQVTNNSWGGWSTSQALEDAFNYAQSKDVVSLAAAGNNNQDASGFTPANINSVIAVAASDSQDAKCAFSNYGAKVDVTAPGGGQPNELGNGHNDQYNILSAMADDTALGKPRPWLKVANGYWRLAGTSMACPHVAGVAALVKSRHPEFSNDEVRQLIRSSSDALNSSGWDVYSGYGRINAYRATLIEDPCLAEIISPTSISVYISGSIEILGSAYGRNFIHYRLEYKRYDDDTLPWIAIGDIVTNQITQGILGKWDTTIIEDGHYMLRLTVTNDSGQEFANVAKVNVFNSFLPGWPIKIQSDHWAGAQIAGSPILADIDSDGDMEIILAVNNVEKGGKSKLFIWHHDGTLVDGWPQYINFYGASATASVSDIDGDGMPEIILTNAYDMMCSVHVWRNDGQTMAPWPLIIPGFGLNVVVSDIDNDSKKEIIVGGSFRSASDGNYINEVYAFEYNGEMAAGWPVILRPSPMNGPISISIADIDNNGGQDIIVYQAGAGFAGFPEESYQFPEGDGYRAKVFVFNGDGTPLNDFVTAMSEILDYSMTEEGSLMLGDIDKDGNIELVVYGGRYIYVWNSDGTPALGWYDYYNTEEEKYQKIKHWRVRLGEPNIDPLRQSSTLLSYPVISDLDKDGFAELIAVNEDHANRIKTLHAFEYNGRKMQGWPINFDEWSWEMLPHGNASISGDLDGDGFSDIILGPESKKLYAFNKEGLPLKGWPIEVASGYLEGSPAIGDINNDGYSELVFCSWDGVVYVVSTEGRPADIDWPMYKYDTDHSGFYKSKSSGNLVPSMELIPVSPKEIKPGESFEFLIRARDKDNDYIDLKSVDLPGAASFVIEKRVAGETTGRLRWVDFKDFFHKHHTLSFTACDGKEEVSFDTIVYQKGLFLLNPIGDRTVMEEQELIIDVSTIFSDCFTNIKFGFYEVPASDNVIRFLIDESSIENHGDGTATIRYIPSRGNMGDHKFIVIATGYAADGKEVASEEITIKVTANDSPPLNEPTGLNAVVIGKNKIGLRWFDNSNNEDVFKIERAEGSVLRWGVEFNKFNVIAVVPADTTSFIDTNLTSGKEYSYRIRAYNSTRVSKYSNIAYVNNVEILSIELEGPSVWELERVHMSELRNNTDTTGKPMHAVKNTGNVPVNVEIKYGPLTYGPWPKTGIKPGIRQGLNTFITKVRNKVLPPARGARVGRIGRGETAPLSLTYGAPTKVSGGEEGHNVTYEIRAYKAAE